MESDIRIEGIARYGAPGHLFTDGYRMLREFVGAFLLNSGRASGRNAVDRFILHELRSFTDAAQEKLINDLNARHRAS